MSTTTTTTTITEPAPDAPAQDKVTFGAAELDQRQRGWHRYVDTEKLDLWSDEDCVLGQLHGTYEDGLEHFRWTDEEAELRGFYVPYSEDLEDRIAVGVAYMELVDFWCQEINARLRADDQARALRELAEFPASIW